jgi:hypothetical protein
MFLTAFTPMLLLLLRVSCAQVRAVLGRILDGSRFEEFKSNYGKTLVTGEGASREFPCVDSKRHVVAQALCALCFGTCFRDTRGVLLDVTTKNINGHVSKHMGKRGLLRELSTMRTSKREVCSSKQRHGSKPTSAVCCFSCHLCTQYQDTCTCCG